MKVVKEIFGDIRAYLATITTCFTIYKVCEPTLEAIDRWIISIIGSLLFIVFYSIYGYYRDKKRDKNDNKGVFFTLDRNHDADRDKYFQDLRNSAKEDVMIMGIGLSNVSRNISTLREEIKLHKKIKLLMFEPEYFSNASHLPDNFILDCIKLDCNNSNKTNIDKSIFDKSTKHFLNFFKEQESYVSTIKNSKKELVEFINSLDRKAYPEATIELKTYKSIIPINMTMIDINKLIVEFCLPYTDERIMGEFSKEYSAKIFNKSKKSLLNIWEDAKSVAKFPNN